jgi:signal transduction histidine kinase/ActR/RegA family two-component response regulator
MVLHLIAKLVHWNVPVLFIIVVLGMSAVYILLVVLSLAVTVLAVFSIRLWVSLRKAAADRNALAAAHKDMETAVRIKSEFFVGMSHNIQTPLDALTSFSEILIQRSLQNCSAEYKDEIEGIRDIIKKNSSSLRRIINDVFDYIRIDANLLEIESTPMSIKQVIHDLCHQEKPNAIAKHLDLSIKYSGEIPPFIVSDPARIRQILLNFIGNAIKYTDKGSITVLCEVFTGGTASAADSSTDSVKTTDRKRHDPFAASSLQIKISVIDTGIGIAPSHIQELFKPFKHADSVLMQSKSGPKLGLTIAHRLATLMDGTIEVESVLGQGSTFSLLLNVYEPEGTPPPLLREQENTENVTRMPQLHDGLAIRMPKKKDAAPSDAHHPLQDLRILVVEDMAVNQVVLATLLRAAGAQVVLADNGAMGVQKVLQDLDAGLLFDAILMDMQMPVMDGYEATAYLRDHDYNRPIIAVTAHALTGDREKTLEAGCDDYLAKPIDNRALIAMIRKHVGLD